MATPAIGFSVARTIPMETASQPVILTFDRIIFNEGGAFDAPSSEFLAPIEGIYAFIFSGYSDTRKNCDLSLTINGTDTVHAFASTGNVMTTNQVLMHMRVNDRAWVTIHANSSTAVGDLYTSFIGYHLVSLSNDRYDYDPYFVQDDYSNKHDITTYPDLYTTETTIVDTYDPTVELTTAWTTSSPASAVTFSAVRTMSMIASQGAETILFDKLMCNVGYGFDHNTGTFTAPRSGQYLVLVSVTKHAQYNTSVLLTFSSQTGKTLSAYTDTSQTITLSVIPTLQANERLSLVLDGGYGISNATFSAHLLNEPTALLPATSLSDDSFATEQISFSAGRVSYFHSGISPVTLIFDQIFSNSGSGFSFAASHFYAPIDGTYIFLFNAKPADTSGHKIRLLHNGNHVVGSAALTVGQMAGNQALLRLRALDSVWLDLLPSGSVEGHPTYIRATFSGYRLF